MESSYEEIVVWFHMEDLGLLDSFGTPLGLFWDSFGLFGSIPQFGIQTWQDLMSDMSQFGSGELMFHVSKCQSLAVDPVPGKLRGSKTIGFEMFQDSPPILQCLLYCELCDFFRTKAFASQRMNSLGSGQSS